MVKNNAFKECTMTCFIYSNQGGLEYVMYASYCINGFVATKSNQ